MDDKQVDVGAENYFAWEITKGSEMFNPEE